MNILFITWNFPPKMGGMEAVAFNLYQGFKARHGLYTITCHLEKRLGDPNLFSCPMKGLLPFLIYAMLKGCSLMLTKRIDVIFTSSAFTAPVAVILGKVFRKRCGSAVHGSDLVYANRIYQRFIRFFLPHCDLVTANSTFTKHLAQSHHHILPERIKVISPGVHPGQFQLSEPKESLKAKHGLSERFVILSAGRLTRRKGIVEFLSTSLPQIKAKYPQVMFLIAGGDPKDSLVHKEVISLQIVQIIQNLGLNDHARYLGRVSDDHLIELYTLCDLFVLPALSIEGDVEGFGIVCMEAAAAGRAVVATESGGISDAVVDQKTGMLLPPGDFDRISNAICDLIEHPDKRRQMEEQSKRHAEFFSWNAVIERYLSAIDSCK